MDREQACQILKNTSYISEGVGIAIDVAIKSMESMEKLEKIEKIVRISRKEEWDVEHLGNKIIEVINNG